MMLLYIMPAYLMLSTALHTAATLHNTSFSNFAFDFSIVIHANAFLMIFPVDIDTQFAYFA